MNDGDVVATAFVRRAQQNAELYAAMVLWQTKGRSSDLPAEWLEAATKDQTVRSLARKARSIRRIREKESDRIIKAIQREQKSDDKLMRGFRDFSTKIKKPRLYIDLKGKDTTPAFHTHAQT